MDRPYYSERAGRSPRGGRFDLAGLKRLFLTTYDQLSERGFFQQDLGYHCVDAGFIPGSLGTDPAGELFLSLKRDNLWPFHQHIDAWSEDDLFDVIEFLFDHASEPTESTFHSYSDCGIHATQFNRKTGQVEYRGKITRVLKNYDQGFELSAEGQVLALADPGLTPLLEAPLTSSDPTNVDARVAAAIAKYRRHRAALEDRKDAIRDLADVLEYLRPQIKTALDSKDETDLFNIANNFGIRHHNASQKQSYDKAIWYSWLFYYYLATIHAAVRLIARGPAGPA
jgi:hypothetical protein